MILKKRGTVENPRIFDLNRRVWRKHVTKSVIDQTEDVIEEMKKAWCECEQHYWEGRGGKIPSNRYYDRDKTLAAHGSAREYWPSSDNKYDIEAYYLPSGCHWVAPIITEIMNIICPDEEWHTQETTEHSCTVSMDGKIVVDILHKLQGRLTGAEIIGHKKILEK